MQPDRLATHAPVAPAASEAADLRLPGDARAPLLTFAISYLLLGLHYEWVHCLAHIAWCPPLGYYRRRVLEHRLHHFRSEHHWWGVSMGLGDRLFGTAPDPRGIAPTGTARDIG